MEGEATMLFLIESTLPSGELSGAQAWKERLEAAAQGAGGQLHEFQVGTDLGRVYAVVEFQSEQSLRELLQQAGIPFDDLAQVRLVGTAPQEPQASPETANYLVEWDFPKGLTMEAYLARKQANSPKYALVPEVKFLRTYVREDMAKCLCLYQAPDQEAVCRAREAVSAPISRLTRLAREQGPARE